MIVTVRDTCAVKYDVWVGYLIFDETFWIPSPFSLRTLSLCVSLSPQRCLCRQCRRRRATNKRKIDVILMMHTQVQAKLQTKLMRHKQDKRICYCHHEMISDAKFMYKKFLRRIDVMSSEQTAPTATTASEWRKKSVVKAKATLRTTASLANKFPKRIDFEFRTQWQRC